MKSIIIGCSKGLHLSKKIARRLKITHSALKVKRFPDGELYLRFLKDVKGKTAILVQSFYGNIDELIIETLFASATAKGLGAKKIILVAPYFPYFRQDKRFKNGECASINAIGPLFDNYFDKIIVVDPHLHREKDLGDIFKKPSIRITANPLIANYIKHNYTKHNFKNPVIIGPDWESYKWARRVAELLNAKSLILEKTRFSSRNVKVKLRSKAKLKNNTAIIVDDIISTGHTILETIKKIKKLMPRNIICICVHGIFAENALKKIRKAGVTVIAVNTIPSSVAKIDVSDLIAKNI